MHWMYPYGNGWYVMALVWVLIIVAVAIGIGWFSRRRRGVASEESAIEILRKRYARGEISREEFEEKKKDLA